MSRLDELIAELCPDGVPFRKVKDVYTRLRGTPITAGKMKEIENPEGNIRVFAGGKTVIDAMESDIPNANIIRVPAVLVQSRGIIDAVFYDKPFTFKNEMWAYTHTETISVKYLYYVLKNNIQIFRDAASGMGSLPQISLPVTEEFELPVPPLPIQGEIVRILDNFTELTAELTARKRQYGYYSKLLLDQLKKDNPSFPLSSFGKWSGGKTPSMAIKRFWENGTIPWISSKDMKSSILQDTEDHIADCSLKEAGMTLCPKDCIAVVTRSGILKHTFPIAFVPFRTTVNQDIKMLVTKNGIAPKYVYYAMKAYAEEIRISTKKQGGTVDSLDFQKVLEYKIPLPSVEKQQHLIQMFDRLDALCNDLTSGLPAEIAVRQKQYEYYRDKLLTFKKLA